MSGEARAIARNLGWMLASRSVLAVLSLIYLAIVTRTLGLGSFGRFALIVGASQALAVFVGFQTWQIIVRYGAEHIRTGDERRLARLLQACGLLDACSALVGTVLAVLVIVNWGEALGVRPVHARAAVLFTAVQLLTIRSTPLGILRLRDRYSLAALADSVTPLARLAGAVAAAVMMPTITGFLLAWGLAEVLTAATYWWLVARTGDLELITRRDIGLGGAIREHPGIVRFAIGTNANSTLGLSSKQIPLLLVGGIGGVASAGAFRLALQLAQALTKLAQLVARAAFPEFVRAMGAGGMQRIGSLLWRSCLLVAVVAPIVFLIIVGAGKPALTLMGGSEFAIAYPVLIWLGAAGCIDLMTAGFEPLLMAANRTGRTFLARLAGTAVLLAISYWLSEQLGVIGVGVAVLGNSVIVALILAAATVQLLRTGAGKQAVEKA